MEVALNDVNKGKTLGDMEMLIREGKTNSTSLYHIIDNDPCFNRRIIQIKGAQVIFITVVYDRHNLFLAVPQFEIKMPTTIEELIEFDLEIAKLLTFKDNMEYIAAVTKNNLQVVHFEKEGIFNHGLSQTPPSPRSSIPTIVS